MSTAETLMGDLLLSESQISIDFGSVEARKAEAKTWDLHASARAPVPTHIEICGPLADAQPFKQLVDHPQTHPP